MKLLPAGPTRGPRLDADLRTPTVVLVEPDPYLAFLIRLHVPEARVLEAEPGADGRDILAMEPDLVVMGVESWVEAIGDLMAAEQPPKVLAVVDGARASRTTIPAEVDGVLARPFVPAELHRAVRGALGLPGPADDGGTIGPALARARSWLPAARFGGVAIAAVLEVGGTAVSNVRASILAIAFVYVTLRWLLRRTSPVVDAADVAVATAIIAATGGIQTNYLVFGLVVVVGVGLVHGPRWAVLAGSVVVGGSLPPVIVDVQEGLVTRREFVAWVSLLPLAGLTGGFLSRVWRVHAQEGLGLLVEANRVLSSLYRIARALPGGLEIGTVADAAMSEIRDTMRSSAGGMLLSEAGTYQLVGSFGLRDPTQVIVRSMHIGLGAALHAPAKVIRRDEFHPDTAAALGDHECWLSAPIRRDGMTLGLLLAACPGHSQHDANRLLLQQLAQEVAVAVENAQLFARVRELSIDEERRRLARELHDGVAQALTHLRYELDFIARHGATTPQAVQREITRLTRVVERASGDVRSMILGLRSSVSADGLVGSLRSYLGDLRGLGGPEILFDARGEARLSPEIEAEVFRVTQEAVSNAMRHAGATWVRVSLISGSKVLRLTVEDDGVGMRGKRGEDRGTGVGLAAMRERAELIGATLTVDERVGGGTRVRLEYTMEGKA